MDEDKARQLLAAERDEVEGLLRQLEGDDGDERSGDAGDSVDMAQPLEYGERDEAVEAGLREKLAAIDRAEQRLAEGTYGLSIRSGEPIPDARLEVQPTAELTVAEAQEAAPQGS